jgi:hypothetical protein
MVYTFEGHDYGLCINSSHVPQMCKPQLCSTIVYTIVVFLKCVNHNQVPQMCSPLLCPSNV